MHDQHPRRDALKAGALAAGAAVLTAGALSVGAPLAAAQPARPAGARRARVARIGMINDLHLMPEYGAFEGVRACLAHLMAQQDKPDFLLTGGDLVDRSMSSTEQRTAALWELCTKVLRDECGLPALHCIGNHDVWGWNKARSQTTGSEARWGKNWWKQAVGVEHTYYAADRGPWRILVLDSIYAADLDIKPKEGVRNPPKDIGRYIGKLGDEQLDWLERELGAVERGRPVMIVSHIPLLSIAAVEHDARTASGDWVVPAGVMHIDAQEVTAMFRNSGNVRLCLSGHIHKNDRIDYEGTTYINAGAVSGSWWRGREDRCDEGYSLIDLYDDGSFAYDYLTYGWQARNE